MVSSPAHLNNDHAVLYAEAEKFAKLMEQGRKPGSIFISKYNPRFAPPDLLGNPRGNEVGEAPQSLLPPIARDNLLYDSRPAYGIKELHANFTQMLAGRGIEFAPGLKGTSCFTCANSVNSTLVPNLFRSDLFRQGGNAADEVLFCAPVYGLLPQAAQKAKLKVVIVPTEKEKGYKPQATEIQAALKAHPDARSLVIVNPANPTGQILGANEIDAIADVIAEHNRRRRLQGKRPLIVVVDQTFHALTWQTHDEELIKIYREGFTGGDKRSWFPKYMWAFAQNKKIAQDTITLGSASKSLAPGLGFAYAYGSPDYICEMSSHDGPSYDVQRYAAKIFGQDAICREAMAEHIEKSIRSYEEDFRLLVGCFDRLNQKLREKFGGSKPYIRIFEPEAGFHAAVDFSGLKDFRLSDRMGKEFPAMHTLRSSGDLAVELMHQAGVVAYPGEMFYLKGEDMILRFSLNLERSKLNEAMTRLEAFCLSLAPPQKWVDKTSPRLEQTRQVN